METLLQKARAGDGEAFIRLMEEHKTGMYKVARAYLSRDADVADAMQQTILDCFEKLDSLRSEAFFKTWLIRILINNCKDILRQNRRVQPVEPTSVLWEEMPQEETQGNLAEFLDTLNQLDERYRKVLVLYYVEELKIKEIARLLNCREATVSTWLRRGRICYREVLARSC